MNFMPTLTRRQALVRTLQGAAACMFGSSLTSMRAAEEARPTASGAKSKLRIGISTLGFENLSNADLAKELSASGVRLIQLFLNQTDSRFWSYNFRADVSSLTPNRCEAIADSYRRAGISIHSLGVYTNLIHPEETERKANLAYFEAMMEVGRRMGVRAFVTEAGHYHDPKGPEASIPLHFQDAVWLRIVAVVRQLAVMAEKFDARILLEPYYLGFLASAKRLRLFLEEVNSPRIRALLDPANLIEVNDLEEMFHQLAPWTKCIHAKDRKLHTNAGVAAGRGDLDYRTLVTLAAKYTPQAPLILEYVGPQDYQSALAHLRHAMTQVGIEES